MALFQILPMKEILKILGISKSTLYRLLNDDPTFPKPIRLGARRVGFRDTDLKDWVDSQNPDSDPEPQGA